MITMDYGSDGWLHEITFVDTKQPDKKYYPKCIAGKSITQCKLWAVWTILDISLGKNACPPEDCNPDGYRDILAALSDRNHADHEETKEWLEDSGYNRFNPKKFNVSSVSF